MANYQVLMRKLRPMTFDEVIGQKHVVETLKNSIKANRIAHAYLFSGTRGVGKTTVARILAKAISCENQKDGEPCNKCDTCLAINNSSMVDVQEIDGASNNGVDAIRELRENIIYPPLNSKYKIYIIDEVHMLSASAFNALLKTLEEPPDHGIFILATTETHKVPQTIISRCQHFDFKKISIQDIKNSILSIAKREDFSITEDAAILISREAKGSIRDSLSILEQTISFANRKIEKKHVLEILGAVDRSTVTNIIQDITNGKVIDALDKVQKIYKGGYDLERVANYMVEIFRDSVMLALNRENKDLINSSEGELNILAEIVQEVSIEDLEHWFRMSVKLLEETSRSSLPELIFEIGIVSMARKPKFTEIGNIIESLKTSSSTELVKKKSKIEEVKPLKQKTHIEDKNKIILKPTKPTSSEVPDFYKKQKEDKMNKVKNSPITKIIEKELKDYIIDTKINIK